jgi:hypothetical protein
MSSMSSTSALGRRDRPYARPGHVCELDGRERPAEADAANVRVQLDADLRDKRDSRQVGLHSGCFYREEQVAGHETVDGDRRIELE